MNEVFGIGFHPFFPKLIRNVCDDTCGCGMYPSHMYGRVGVQFMVEEDAPVSRIFT